MSIGAQAGARDDSSFDIDNSAYATNANRI
jgi:hypothetical protein